MVSLVKEFPKEAQKAGLTVEMIKEEVKEAKEQAKAVGGMVHMGKKHEAMLMPVKDTATPVISKAVGGAVPKVKKPRSEAQKAAIAKLVAMNKKKREEKK